MKIDTVIETTKSAMLTWLAAIETLSKIKIARRDALDFVRQAEKDADWAATDSATAVAILSSARIAQAANESAVDSAKKTVSKSLEAWDTMWKVLEILASTYERDQLALMYQPPEGQGK